MAKSTEFNLTLKVTDKASRPVYEAYQKLDREGKAFSNNERQRKMLGIRGERQIQAEILRTQRAYQQLERSGKVSSNELARAKQVELRRVRELNTELSRSQSLGGQRLRNGLATGGALLAGAYGTVKAASSLVMDPIQKVYDKDKSIRGITRTAFAGADVEGLNNGEQKVRQIADDSLLNIKGTTNDQILEALDTAFGEGLNVDDVERYLPSILKTSVGTGTGSAIIAKVVASMIDNEFSPDDIEKSLNQLVNSGMKGKFALPGLAEIFPEMLSFSKSKGLSVDQLPQMLETLQVLTKSSGSSDLATTQYKRLLVDMSQGGFAERVAKAQYIDPETGKNKSIDWTKSLAKAAEDGKSPIETAISIMEDILNSDSTLKKAYGNLDSKDATVKDQASTKIMESKALGEIFGNEQAIQAILGLLQNKDSFKKQVIDTRNAGNIVDHYYQYETGSAGNKNQTFWEKFKGYRDAALKPAADWWGDKSKDATDLMDNNPNATKGAIWGATAAGALGTGAAMYGGAKFMLGGGARVAAPIAGEVAAASAMASGGSGMARMFLSGALRGLTHPAVMTAPLLMSGTSREEVESQESLARRFRKEKVEPFEEKYGEGSAKRARKMFGSWRDTPANFEESLKLQEEYMNKYEQHVRNMESARRKTDPDLPQFADSNYADQDSNSSSFNESVVTMGRNLEDVNRVLVADIARSMEALQNAVPKEIIVNMPVLLDGRVIYDNVERVMINQLNRGA